MNPWKETAELLGRLAEPAAAGDRAAHEAEVLSWPASALCDLDVPEDYAKLRTPQGGT